MELINAPTLDAMFAHTLNRVHTFEATSIASPSIPSAVFTVKPVT
jgi:hypothetical protein